ncbi:MAG: glycosyltransferase family 4 protein, partial [Candidatus Helarchaeota archaeon]
MVSWRICYMIPGFFPIAKGGAEVFTLNLCKSLLKQGHRVIIVTRNLKLPSEAKIKGIYVKRFANILPYKIKYYGFGRFLRSKYIRMLVAGFDLIAVVPVLWNLHKKNKFHLIHASFIFPFGLAGLIFKNIFKLPLVITVHGPADFYEVPRFFNPILRFVLRRANAVAVVGEQLKKDLLKRLGYLPIKVVLNGIPIKPFELTERELQIENYSIYSRDFVILTAGRLVRRKNLDLLIRSIPKIQKKIAHSKLVILGSGIERKNLEKLIKDLQLESSIILPGWVSEEEKRKIFKRADIFLQLSYFEGLSLALLESKA